MAGILKTALSILALAILTPFLYDRYVGFGPLLANRAGKFVEYRDDSLIKDVGVKFAGEIRNCEDVMLVEDLGVAVLSCDEGRDRWNTVMGTFRPDLPIPNGRLYIYDYTAPQPHLQPITLQNFSAHEQAAFHPLGLEYDAATSTLYVVNHARSGSRLDIFTIDFAAATATHRQTFKHPLLHAPNSIHSLGSGKLYVTNDHFVRSAVSTVLSKIETFSGVPGGTVTYIDVDDAAAARVVARVPFANGVVMLNRTTLAVGSSSKPGVYLFDVAASDYSLVRKQVVRTPASVDNLSVDASGALLLAGHPDPFRLFQVSKTRWACVVGSDVDEERRACGCVAPSWAGEWTEAKGLRTLLMSEGFCSSSTVVRDVERGVGMVSGLYADGVLEFRV